MQKAQRLWKKCGPWPSCLTSDDRCKPSLDDAAIDLAPVTNLHDEDDPDSVFNGIEDPVLPDPDPIEIRFPSQLLAPRRAGISAEGCDLLDDPLAIPLHSDGFDLLGC